MSRLIDTMHLGRDRVIGAFVGDAGGVRVPPSGFTLVQAAPPEQMHLGLARYWRKRVEREAA